MHEELTVDDYKRMKFYTDKLLPLGKAILCSNFSENDFFSCKAPLGIFKRFEDSEYVYIEAKTFLKKWCNENLLNTAFHESCCSYDEIYDNMIVVFFKNEEDAVAFKLRWA